MESVISEESKERGSTYNDSSVGAFGEDLIEIGIAYNLINIPAKLLLQITLVAPMRTNITLVRT